MQVVDESLWHQQASELQEDEVGKEFLGFLTEWLDTAEQAMKMDEDLSPIHAFRSTLAVVEESRGRVSANFIGQMMVVTISHWQHGQQLFSELSAIEKRMVEDMIILKIRELEESARQEVPAEC